MLSNRVCNHDFGGVENLRPYLIRREEPSNSTGLDQMSFQSLLSDDDS
jgi:hypothetical protein